MTAVSVLPVVLEPATPLGRTHARRLREIYRSAGWPCQDMLEIELLAAGMLERVASAATMPMASATPRTAQVLLIFFVEKEGSLID